MHHHSIPNKPSSYLRSSILCSAVKEKERDGKKMTAIVGYWHMAKVWGNVKDLLRSSYSGSGHGAKI